MKIERGDVVQIDPEHHHWLGGCFAIVSDVHEWGLRAYVPLPSSGSTPIRLENGSFALVGKAEWTRFLV